MTYRVETARDRVGKQLRRIPKADLGRISTAIITLADEPRPMGVVQLQKDIYRMRVGNYRIIYKVYDEEELILIGRVVRRSESTYQRVEDLFE
ncbi:MAG: type II toxin-antitoxin system RelE/ParE family toxin [Chloroflexi bacterium]|nr:type II toxin-antitoxin system RelE/ParE family toxin [Chloroflexota bacterium]